MVLTRVLEDIYVIIFSQGSRVRTCLIAKFAYGWLCHRRLGHVGLCNLNKLIKSDHVLGVRDVIFDKQGRTQDWAKPRAPD